MSDKLAIRINQGLLVAMITGSIAAIIKFNTLEVKMDQVQASLLELHRDHDRVTVLEQQMSDIRQTLKH